MEMPNGRPTGMRTCLSCHRKMKISAIRQRKRSLAGRPCLVTDRCGIAPIVDRRAGVVVPHDCAALEAGLGKILDDPAFAARLRAGCREVARSLGWAEPLAEMESLYRKLISERHNG